MFSLTYLFKSIELLLAYPSALVGILQCQNPSLAIDKQQRIKWKTVSRKFANNPKRVKGFSIFLNPDDRSAVSSSIGNFGWLNLALTELFKKTVKRGITVVDAGANIGYYTLLASSLVGEMGHVFAFEPDPENFALLTKSIEYNRFHNIKAEQAALTSRAGIIELNLSDTPTGHTTAKLEPTGTSRTKQSERKILVSSVTLDSLSDSKKIDMIKIHTSGSEPDVLRGGRKMIEEHHPRIIVSYVPKLWQGEENLLDFIKAHYQIFELVQSPFLIRRINFMDPPSWRAAELYLVPRSSDL